MARVCVEGRWKGTRSGGRLGERTCDPVEMGTPDPFFYMDNLSNVKGSVSSKEYFASSSI